MWISDRSINSNINISDYDCTKEKLEYRSDRDITDIFDHEKKNKKKTKKSECDKSKKNKSSPALEKYDKMLKQAKKNNKQIDENIDKIKKETILLDTKIEQIKLNGIEYTRAHKKRIQLVEDSINKASQNREHIQENIKEGHFNKNARVRFEVLKARIKHNQSHISLYKQSIEKMKKNLKKNEKLLISQSKVNGSLIDKQEDINNGMINDTKADEAMSLMITNERMQNENEYLKDNNQLLVYEFNDYEDICVELQNERALFEKGLQKILSIIRKKCRNVKLKKLSKLLAEKVCNNAHDTLSKVYSDFDI